jgi:hypothetical protein
MAAKTALDGGLKYFQVLWLAAGVSRQVHMYEVIEPTDSVPEDGFDSSGLATMAAIAASSTAKSPANRNILFFIVALPYLGLMTAIFPSSLPSWAACRGRRHFIYELDANLLLAKTFAGLAVKACELHFDTHLSTQCDFPEEDQDWQERVMSQFVAELDRLAAARGGQCLQGCFENS